MALEAILLDAAVLDIEDFVQTDRVFVLAHRARHHVNAARAYPGLDFALGQQGLV